MPLEVLDGSFMFLSGGPCFESAQISPFSGLWVGFSRIEPVEAGFELSDH
jgi:hypothetical protein